MIAVSEPYYKVVSGSNIDLARGVYFRRVPLRLVLQVDFVLGDGDVIKGAYAVSL